MKRAGARILGFTLMEMLVTLVVLSLVMGILGTAMHQLGRVERQLGEERMQASAAALRVEWLRALMQGFMPGDSSAGERFTGTESELEGLSVAVPRYPRATLNWVRLALRYNESTGSTELWMREGRPQPLMLKPLPELLLLQWPGRRGRFRYQGPDEVWQDRWQPAGNTLALPRQVLLELDLPGVRQLLAHPQADVSGMPSRRYMEQL